MASPIHVGTTPVIEVVIRDGTPVDISAATTKEILLQRLGGALLTRAAAFSTDGTNGAIRYKALTTDFDAAGDWRVSARVVTPADTIRTEVLGFRVHANPS